MKQNTTIDTVSARPRLHALDTLRGFAVVNMILYHLCWNLVHLSGLPLLWFSSSGARVWQQCICYTFILLSGFCFSMGRRKFRRGLTVFGGGLAVTAVTALVMPQSRILFGILTLLGTCMLLLIPTESFLRKIHPVLGFLAAALLFFFTRNLRQGFFGFAGLKLAPAPQWLYRNTVTTFFGFPYEGFYSSDYFPLIPWLFLFLAGFFLFHFLEPRGGLGVLKRGKLPFLSFVGRHALLIYLLHQPVLYLLCLLFGA